MYCLCTCMLVSVVKVTNLVKTGIVVCMTPSVYEAGVSDTIWKS